MKELVDDINLNRKSKNNKISEATTNTATTGIRHSYVVTGVVANARLSPLLPKEWVDITPNRVDASDDVSTADSYKSQTTMIPSFLWENSPRRETKGYRDDVTVYSHLPNGINILDSKWVLGRLFADDYDTRTRDSSSKKVNRNPLLATCKTHLFCGLNGFNKFAESVKLLTTDNNNDHNGDDDGDDQKKRRYELERIISDLPDLAVGSSKSPSHLSAEQKLVVDRPPINMLNWWVVKDAGSNGAGGVWVVGRENAKAFGDCDSGTSPLFESHKYVAQEYVWPPVLYDGKKCHVRVYVTITCDGQAFIHRRAFLHVANNNFTIYNDDAGSDDGNTFKDSTHITNCCANSHDDDKFAGEILADFCETKYTTWKSDDDDDLKQQPIIPLADFFPSVQATVSAVVQKTFRKGFIEGGQKNNGFEYCGMDFMLSYKKKEDVVIDGNNSDESLQPVAYLLEINSPPSQDTASSLPHAENLHNEVLRDWMTYWIIPKIDHNYLPIAGGWQHCSVSSSDRSDRSSTSTGTEQVNNSHERKEDLILPSKASILNKIRWALYESKVQKNKMQQNGGNQDRNDEVTNINEHDNNNDDHKGTQLQSNVKHADNGDDYACNDNVNTSTTAIEISRFARSQFPFFSSSSCLTNGDVANNQNDNNNKSTFNDSKQQQQQIFFENAGGTQVPQSVIDCVQKSLIRRHREIIGNETKAAARETLRKILVGGNEKKTDASSVVLLGLNTTSLLVSLAQRYVQLLSSTDEVVLSTENHVANFEPWIEAATTAGATIKLWTPFRKKHQDEHSSSSSSSSSLPLLSKYETSSNINDLITPHTRVVALPHASNVLGSIRPISALSKMIKYHSNGYAHVVVDGVAVAAHAFVGLDENFGGNVDWYVVSIHKLFGPHLGVLMANQQSKSIEQFLEANDPSCPGTTTNEERLQILLESGTANNESCAGAKGLGMYFKLVSNWYEGKLGGKSAFTSGIIATDTMVSMREVRLVYSLFRKVETSLLKTLIRRLSRYPLVRILDGSSMEYLHCGSGSGSDRSALLRLPTVSFVHKIIPSRDIYTFCLEKGIICRHGFFLCTNYLSDDFNFSDNQDGVFRISLAHYNTSQEVETICDNFEKMPRWDN